MSRKAALVGGTALAVVVLGAGGTAFALSGDDDQPIPSDVRDRVEQAALAETGGGSVTDAEVDDEESKYEVEVTLENGSEVDVQLDEDFQVVGTKTDDDHGDRDDDGDDHDGSDDVPVAAADRQRAEQAALAETGDGTVTGVESEGTGYEVEVTRTDGTEVDVHLDEAFTVTRVVEDGHDGYDD